MSTVTDLPGLCLSGEVARAGPLGVSFPARVLSMLSFCVPLEPGCCQGSCAVKFLPDVQPDWAVLCGGESIGLLAHWSFMVALNMFSVAVNLETVCADDLLSVLLYLLVKTEIPNW